MRAVDTHNPSAAKDAETDADTDTDSDIPATLRGAWAPWVPALGLSLSIVLVTAVAIRQELQAGRSEAATELSAAARARAGQVDDWVASHMKLARFMESSSAMASRWLRWADNADAQAGQEMLLRAQDAASAMGADAFSVVDAAARTLSPALAKAAPSARAPDTPPPALVVQAVADAVAQGQTGTMTIPAHAADGGAARLAVVVPLLQTGTPARAVLLMQVDPRRVLLPTLQLATPADRATSTDLWEIADGRVADLSGPATSEALAVSTLPVALAARADPAAPSGALDNSQAAAFPAVDELGHQVVAAVQQVAGTHWWLVVKRDLANIDAPAWQRARWMALAGALGVIGTLLFARMRLQRRALARGAAQERRSAELQALVLDRTAALQSSNGALRRALRFNRNVTDSIPGRVAYWDRQLRCQFANRSFADRFGMEPAALEGRTADELFGPQAMADVRERIDAALRGEPQVFENDTVQPDGSVVTHQVHYLPESLSSDAERGVFVMGFDITELKRSQAALKQLNTDLALARDAADAANRAKSSFLANVSHEIRTPMNAIIGLTHLMARDSVDDRQRDRLGKVAGAAQHLRGIIDEVLDLSKIEAGKLQLDDNDFDTQALLASALALVQDRAQAKGLALLVDAPGLPPTLRGDALRLSQVLINLLTNAVKFTEQGQVLLRARLVSERGNAVRLRFEVEDTGPGIAPAQQALLFTPFEQADNSISRRHGGTGLGLALSRQFARAMGGEAGVDSTPGVGSSFWFTVLLQRGGVAAEDDGANGAGAVRPTVPGALASGAVELDNGRATPLLAVEQQLRSQHRGQRVLLAEDNAINREVAEDLLRGVGLQVTAVDDGALAVERALTEPYDLILMDMQMPVLDGLEATRQIRAQAPRRTPILAMTANAFIEDRQACLDAGMDDHLSKPVDPVQLFTMLLRWLPDADRALQR